MLEHEVTLDTGGVLVLFRRLPMLVKNAFGFVVRFAGFASVMFFLYVRGKLLLVHKKFIAKVAIDITVY